MKIVHPYYFDPIIIEDDSPETLVVEDNQHFRKLVSELIEQYETDEGEFVLSEDNELLSISKKCLLINDLFHLDVNNKSIKNKLLQEIVSEVSENDYFHLLSGINDLGNDICNQSRFPIMFNTEISLTNLLKWLNFEIDDTATNLIETLMDYIRLNIELLSKSLVITIGLKDYLSEAEYLEFSKIMKYRHNRILHIEHRTHKFDDTDHRKIIDEDLCVI